MGKEKKCDDSKRIHAASRISAEPQPDEPAARNGSRAKPKSGAAVGSSDSKLGRVVCDALMIPTEVPAISSNRMALGESPKRGRTAGPSGPAVQTRHL